MRSGILAMLIFTGWINVRNPSRSCGSGTRERSSSAGVLMAPPAAMKCLARTITPTPVGV
jgi:hypothetical protein